MRRHRVAPHDLLQRIAARYGCAQNPFAVDLNPVLETLLSHRSVRAFLPDALSEHTLQTLVADARSADWSTQVLNRLRDAAALKGRHRLYAALQGADFGFEDVTGPR